MNPALRITIGATLVALVLASAASAYNWMYSPLGGPLQWSNRTMDLRLSANGYPSGSTWRWTMEAAVEAWNRGPADFEFKLLYGDTSVSPNNGQSESYFSTSEYLLSGAPGVTKLVSWWGFIIEADVIFDTSLPWSTSEFKLDLWPYGGDRKPFKTLAIHELGHALGLDHEDASYNVMGQDDTHLSTNGHWARATPGEDATDGAVDLYGVAHDKPEDVGVTHWIKGGATTSGYSLHKRSEMFNTAGSQLPTFWDTGVYANQELGYEVSPGETVVIQFTFENNGSTSQQPSVGYYLSTNSYISTYDTLLTTAAPTLNRNTVYERNQTLTIPSWANVGQTYYLGAIVDRGNTIAESYESNNATYVAVSIVD